MKVISIGELLDSDLRVEFVINRILPEFGTAILGGAPGLGKSWLLLRTALDIATGSPWLGEIPSKRQNVLMVDEENAASLVMQRLKKLALAAQVDLRALPIFLVIGQGLNFSRKGSVAKLQKVIKRHKIGLVTIDSFVRVHDGEENSATEIARVMRGVKQVTQGVCSVLFTHHTRKPGAFANDRANSLRGSSDIRAFVDTQLTLSKIGGRLVVSHEKSRWCEGITPFGVRIADTSNGGVDVVSTGGSTFPSENATDSFIIGILEKATTTRKSMLPQAKAAGISVRTLDGRLKVLSNTGEIEKHPRIGRETPYGLPPKPANSHPVKGVAVQQASTGNNDGK